EKLPNGIHVIVQPKGWMDGEGVKVWLDKVWSKRPGGLLWDHNDDDDISSRDDSELGDESNSDDFSGFEDE
ncbi:hypothetical protein Hamer_G002466, partial [Homarus americanus]